MVTFDAALPGTAASVWDDVFAASPPLDLDPFTGLLVVAAHPDDETLGAGGLIARFADRGLPVHVVVVTDGAASHPLSPTHGPLELARLRADETRGALAVLAPEATVELLGFPDGGTRENAHEIEALLRTTIARTPATTLVAMPWHGDGHRDHRVIAECVANVAGSRATAEYPIWLWHWGALADVPELRSVSIDAARKTAAIARHVSQVEPLSPAVGDEAMLRPDLVAHFVRGLEAFVVTDRRSTESMPGEYFDALYARRDDPWFLATRWYEERKRAITTASLPQRRSGRVLEIGSSIGMLTEMLRDRCDELVSIDISAAAVEATRARVGDSVTVLQADATRALPDGRFDLVVISEVGYYLTVEDLRALIDRVIAALTPAGTVLACHWRHPVAEYVQTGDDVHAVIAERIGLARLVTHLEDDFVLDVYAADGRSVAAREGLS